MLAYLGFFLILPNVVTGDILIMMYPLMNLKVKQEEAYLINKHEEKFEAYKASVRRWL